MTIRSHYDLTCWYLNLRRIAELIGPASVRNLETSHLDRLRSLAHSKNSVIDWIEASHTPTLGQLLISDKLEIGAPVTHYSNFYCKGLNKWHSWHPGNRGPSKLPEIYSKLDELSSGRRVQAEYHPEHLLSTSSWSTLTGQARLFLFGVVGEINDNVVSIIPYAIASVIAPQDTPDTINQYLQLSRMEVHPGKIDVFSGIDDLPYPEERDLDLLRTIPEKDVKHAFAEIFKEPHVPKDWGGERSDLFTTRVTVDGQQFSTAVAFKGPGHFRPLSLSGLGKNGDQIDRLFTEPAALFILQHCHRIEPSVRGAMRAYANQMGNLRLFSLIDGFDTLRILRMYSKCGLAA